jgi:hypothetical protein
MKWNETSTFLFTFHSLNMNDLQFTISAFNYQYLIKWNVLYIIVNKGSGTWSFLIRTKKIYRVLKKIGLHFGIISKMIIFESLPNSFKVFLDNCSICKSSNQVRLDLIPGRHCLGRFAVWQFHMFYYLWVFMTFSTENACVNTLFRGFLNSFV